MIGSFNEFTTRKANQQNESIGKLYWEEIENNIVEHESRELWDTNQYNAYCN